MDEDGSLSVVISTISDSEVVFPANKERTSGKQMYFTNPKLRLAYLSWVTLALDAFRNLDKAHFDCRCKLVLLYFFYCFPSSIGLAS